MLTVFDWSLAAASLPFLAASLYLSVMTLLWRRLATTSQAGAADRRFVVLVPAHKEALGIARTIESLQAVDYPAALRRIVVVADNCSDNTAAIARAHGAEVIERHDDTLRGKGWALQFAIDRLLASGAGPQAWDALVVIDADTLVAPNLLRAIRARFAQGARAVQAAYLPIQSGRSATAVITEVAFTAFHLVRSEARERLGVSCGLRGNGMAFTHELLACVPHAACSRTEDLEFGVLLGLRGIRVAFAGDTHVWGDMPERESVVATQRERWIGGRMEMARRFVPTLVSGAVRTRSLMLADLAADLAVPPLSLLVTATAAGILISLAVAALSGRAGVAFASWALAGAGLALHVGHAACLAGRGRALLGVASSIPGYAFRKAITSLRAFGPTPDAWVRTAREGERA